MARTYQSLRKATVSEAERRLGIHRYLILSVPAYLPQTECISVLINIAINIYDKIKNKGWDYASVIID
jgi:hypothetical protein